MVTIQSSYEGSLRCSATHGPSETVISTDAPKDNEGLGASFSPTDLVATALATCALTTMGIVAKREGFAFEGAYAKVVKNMVADPKRRIGSLPIQFVLPGTFTDAQRRMLESTARTCPVAMSIRAEIETPLEFSYPDS